MCETPAQHTLTSGHQRHVCGCFLTRRQPPFVQYSTDFRQTKTAVCVLASSSGKSNAREWWVSVRVLGGAECVRGTLPCCPLSAACQRPWAKGASRPSASLNLLADLEFDLYKLKCSCTPHWMGSRSISQHVPLTASAPKEGAQTMFASQHGFHPFVCSTRRHIKRNDGHCHDQ